MTRKSLVALLCATCAVPAWAGPPYDTDDPAPTDTGGWEIYSFAVTDGLGSARDTTAGFDLNYGALPGVQLTATLPVEFSRDSTGTRSGAGDLEIGIKYRFYNNEEKGFSAAIFPRVILPTAARGFGSGGTGVLLPVWVQQDLGKWSVFGGGGYLMPSGSGGRDHWLAGLALSHALSPRVSLGAEVFREGAEARGGSSTTRVNFAFNRKLGGPFAALLAAGPTFGDAGGPAHYHAYTALALNF